MAKITLKILLDLPYKYTSQNSLMNLIFLFSNKYLVSYETNSLNIGKKNYASATEKLENSEVRSIFFTFNPATIADLPSEVK